MVSGFAKTYLGLSNLYYILEPPILKPTNTLRTGNTFAALATVSNSQVSTGDYKETLWKRCDSLTVRCEKVLGRRVILFTFDASFSRGIGV